MPIVPIIRLRSPCRKCESISMRLSTGTGSIEFENHLQKSFHRKGRPAWESWLRSPDSWTRLNHGQYLCAILRIFAEFDQKLLIRSMIWSQNALLPSITEIFVSKHNQSIGHRRTQVTWWPLLNRSSLGEEDERYHNRSTVLHGKALIPWILIWKIS
jgi:hypothetical protein